MIWQVINSVVAVGALVLSLIVFFSEKKEKKLRIKQLLRENEDLLKAELRVHSDNSYIYIENRGENEARNIRFSCSEELVTNPDINEIFPYPKILAGQSVKLKYVKETIESIHQTITIVWDDDYRIGNKNEMVITLAY